jgi:hypothetical protein
MPASKLTSEPSAMAALSSGVGLSRKKREAVPQSVSSSEKESLKQGNGADNDTI